MKVFLDTNVLLDTIVERDNPQFTDDASTILSLGETQAIELFMSALSIPVIAYVIKNVNATRKKAIIKDLISIVKVLPSLPQHVENILECSMNDIEDALQLQSAKEGPCDIIVTRDIADFKESDIPVISPQDLLSRIIK